MRIESGRIGFPAPTKDVDEIVLEARRSIAVASGQHGTEGDVKDLADVVPLE